MKDHFKETAVLIGDPVRATVLWTLLDGRSFTATELAIAADTSASNISMHLAKLVNAGLLRLLMLLKHWQHLYRNLQKKISPLVMLFPPYNNAEPVMTISQAEQVSP